MAFIYKIENINNNKCYIGWTSKSVDFRWSEHKSDAIKIRDNRKFYNAIRKYGVDSWNVTTLCEVNSNEIALKKEIKYIQLYDSYRNGYNATLGGDGNNGIIMSEESNIKRSEKLKGIKKPKGFNVGRIHSDETKDKIRLANKIQFEDSNQREMRKHKSNELWADDKYRQRQIDVHTGKIHGPHSDETKDKIREKMIGRKFSPETIEKMRMSAKNRKCRDGS